MKKKHENSDQAEPSNREEPAVMDSTSEEPASSHRPWQRTVLIVFSWIELVFFALGIVVALIFGIAGFKGGEMGTMLGIVMVLALAGIVLAVSSRAVALWGLVKEQSWASVLTLILSVLEAVMFAFSGFWPLLIYAAFTGWCSVYLLRHK